MCDIQEHLKVVIQKDISFQPSISSTILTCVYKFLDIFFLRADSEFGEYEREGELKTSAHFSNDTLLENLSNFAGSLP